MKRLPVFALILGSLIAGAWSANAGRYPLREIDRPLILPKNLWQERLMQNSFFTSDEGSFEKMGSTPEGFMPSLPAYSLTDNLLWEAVPAPLFRYLVTRNNITAESGPAVKDFSLTLDGGLHAYVYAMGKSTFMSRLGVSAKKPMFNRLWLQGSASTYFDNADFQAASSSVGLGFQLTDRTHLTSAYSLVYRPGAKPGFPEDLFSGLALVAGFNFSPYISLNLHGAMVMGTEHLGFNPGAALSFQW